VTHVAESAHELAALRDGSGPLPEAMRTTASYVRPFGRHPVAELVAHDALGPETIVAHAVEVGPAEIELLARAGCAVAHCPRSNALLGCGVAPVAALLEAGVRVGLGTDSPASALTLDMFDELRAAIMLGRVRERDAGALSAADALRLATLGGAAALGRADALGSLEAGKQADLTVVDVAGTTFHPSDDPVAALVLGGSPERVVRTVVAGIVRYRKDGSVYRAALDRAAAARARMLLSAS
jgi:5-methylthioadenosine/S-adenosylhomocysteine deaminase